jgi:putative transposase
MTDRHRGCRRLRVMSNVKTNMSTCPAMPRSGQVDRFLDAETAAAELEAFEVQWGKRYPAIGQAWRRAWEYVVPLFAFPPAIRKVIYTTNAVESLHRSLRKIIKTRGSFPTDEAALKLLFLAIRNAGIKWRRPVEWTTAMGQFAILFGDRFEPSAR